MKLPNWRFALLMISLVLWAELLVAMTVNAFWTPTFKEVGDIQRGCYLTDAVVFYVQCNGFAFSGIAGDILTLPYRLWTGLLFFPWEPLFDIPFWLVLLFPGWYRWSQRCKR